MKETEYVEVPKKERLDTDEFGLATDTDATEGGDDADDLELYRTDLHGEVIAEDLG
jgi:hypothetical protein